MRAGQGTDLLMPGDREPGRWKGQILLGLKLQEGKGVPGARVAMLLGPQARSPLLGPVLQGRVGKGTWAEDS